MVSLSPSPPKLPSLSKRIFRSCITVLPAHSELLRQGGHGAHLVVFGCLRSCLSLQKAISDALSGSVPVGIFSKLTSVSDLSLAQTDHGKSSAREVRKSPCAAGPLPFDLYSGCTRASVSRPRVSGNNRGAEDGEAAIRASSDGDGFLNCLGRNPAQTVFPPIFEDQSNSLA